MSRPTRIALALCALSLCACSDDDVAPVPVSGSLEAGNYLLEVDDSPALVLSRDGEALLRFDATSFELGVVPAVDDNVNYDPYRLYVPYALYTPLESLRFLRPTAATLHIDEPGYRLELSYPEGQSATLSLAVGGDGHFALTLTPAGERTAFMRIAPRASADEGFYGLGEYFDDVDHRGHVRAMQIEVDSSIESTYNEAHVPVPMVVGTRGWGLFVESPYPGAFAIAHSDDERIEAAFGTGSASSEGLSFHLFAADHPLDITGRYYQVTGQPRLPARWALGPWVWRDENDDQAQVEADLDAMRDLDLATSGYWIDRPYANGVNTFDFNAPQFPDPEAMVAKMHALGFRTALWHTPYLDESDAAAAALVAEAEAGGFYPPQTGINLNGWGRTIDVTNADAVTWWREQLAYYIDLGVEGFKLDYGEDVVSGVFDERTPWSFADGSDERTMHSQYARRYHDVYAELMPQSGGFLLCRGGTYGDQTNGVIIWPGDLDANMTKHFEEFEDRDGKTVTGVGGLPASIVAGLSLGPSGFPFYGADTGGYRHSPPDKETFSRWFEQTALSVVMQIGTSSNDVAWEPTADNGFDQEVLDNYRRYTRLHLRLWPYLWTHAQQLRVSGRPIARALGLAHPELGIHPNDIYLLGDELVSAPGVEHGVPGREVTLPEGTWVHWFTGDSYEGGEHTVDAPLGVLPLFLRAGELVVMLRPTIDSLAPTTEPMRVDSYATDAGLLYARAVAGHDASFALFDGGQLNVSATEVSYSGGNELNNGVVFELVAATKPASVSGLTEVADLASLEAASDGWWFDTAIDTIWIKLTGTSGSATLQ
jgi:alpha-D-xyloside xylohydrolase